MHRRHIASLDLNLLKLLDALLDVRGVTRAAEQLGISQPAASRSLARLRKVLGDPILVRAHGGYRLTPRAEALRPEVAHALRAIEHVFAPAAFEPATSDRRFSIAATDYGTLSVLNRAAPALLSTAPNARLDVVPWSERTLAALADGQVDLALYADDPLPPAFTYRPLFTETFMCLCRRDHPAASRIRRGTSKSRLHALSRFPQAVIAYPSGRITRYDDIFEQLGFDHQRVALTLPYFLAAPWIIAASDLVLVAPTRVAKTLAAVAGLEATPFPFDSAGFEYRIVWHERVHRDPGHQWLRDVLAGSIAP
ncbi:LysR family transcriptional regulator [Thermomonas brevis]|jgi:DNA-binding transcriptional LysR family regulator